MNKDKESNKKVQYPQKRSDKTDPCGSYTGKATEEFDNMPVQDADDL